MANEQMTAAADEVSPGGSGPVRAHREGMQAPVYTVERAGAVLPAVHTDALEPNAESSAQHDRLHPCRGREATAVTTERSHAQHSGDTCEPVDIAKVIGAAHRAEQLATTDPTSSPARAVAAELNGYLLALLAAAEHRLSRMRSGTPAASRAREVLADTVRHARSVHLAEEGGELTNPTARLHLLAGACRLLHHNLETSW
ncbi:hypothetical protein RCR19_43165 (plasmid) [Streptomyces sp. WAC07094]|uniref:hypothetical protein n=1 Tax=Streptomyces sp. WAC07094 TaxID=3072183 RepID=UPI002EB222C2|nr:hypothetical protein [Streptomyces sp. WAC07094]